MISRRLGSFLSACSLIMGASAATAAPSHTQYTTNQPYVTFHAGQFDFLDDTHDAFEFGAEFRLKPWEYGVRPTLGVTMNTDGGFYAFGGVNWEVPLLPNQLYVIPNFMVGAYGDSNDGKDLGGLIEFRSGIELAYQFENLHRVGVAVNHISNAGIYDRNPGAESILVNYSVPISAFSF